ncbi:GDSL-type esterase/lipase family protein [Marinagarivorans cellulosilyticus]|uniref:Uncharacterized protein n=1 Tax=Marinagarivorans cellulosilyticus TaxID=2721545 RepID=A0AAN2BIH8_9GAMM|nr:GDSL-type esterase/lipase family protein [Marinagarivorans cellulosilyticus]BCD95957.1 hypothetical protein MARGE09_P0156 [Marinagarivorans cellulosilyticus]
MNWLKVLLLSSLLIGCVADDTPTSSTSSESITPASSEAAQSSNPVSSSSNTGNASSEAAAESSVPVSSSSLAAEPILQEVIEGSDSLCAFNGIFESTHAGFEGASYVNVDNQNGVKLQWQLSAQGAQTVAVTIRFANGGADARPAIMTVNNVAGETLDFNSTAAWATWDSVTFNVNLVEGENTLALTATTGAGLANIDSITMPVDNLELTTCADAPPVVVPPITSQPQAAKVYVVGDSTVSTYRDNVFPMTGWGQVLTHYFDGATQIINHAIGGRSSRSFYQEGRWQAVVDELQNGDYVFIQFGHNDRDFSKAERYTPTDDYGDYLQMYIDQAKAKGAIPVLVTPMVMNAYRNNVLRNVFTESGNDYAGTMKAVAQTNNVALIDLNQKSFELVQQVGPDYASRYLFMILPAGEYSNYPNGSNDGTHFQQMGAVEMAGLIAEGVREIGSRADMQLLAGNLKPVLPFSVTATVSGAGLVSRNATYPAGAPITLKALPSGNNYFNAWFQSGNRLGTDALMHWTMPNQATRIDAQFNDTAVMDGDNTSCGTAQNGFPYCQQDNATDPDGDGWGWENEASCVVPNGIVDPEPGRCASTSAQPENNYPKATVFLIGDSTVSNYNAGYYPQTGWGQVFQPYFNRDKITVDNRALGGRSSKSFYNDHWNDVKRDIKAGDFVFIQFGINDRNRSDPNRYAPADGTFQDYMTRFARETQALGATPFFVSTVVRNAWRDGGIYEAYHEHPVVTRELARSLNIGLIDLDGAATQFLESVGEDYSTYFMYMNVSRNDYSTLNADKSDNVHFQEMGAVEMARLAALQIEQQKNRDDFKQLAAALRPTYPLTVTGNGNALVTKGYAYPEGTRVTLRYRGSGFNGWYHNGQSLSRNSVDTYTMPAAAVTITLSP